MALLENSTDIAILFSFLFASMAASVLVQKIKVNLPKKATNQTFAEYQDMMATALKDAKAQIKSLQGRNARLRDAGGSSDSQESENDEDDKEFDLIKTQLAARFNIPANLLDSPNVKSGIKQILKDPLVKSALPILAGGKKDQSDPVSAYINRFEQV